MGGNAFDYFTMTFTEELALVATETTVVKKAITKSLARTQATAAKKKKAKKAAKKPKAKKAKKAKKPKKKKKKKKKAKKKKKKRKKKGTGLFKPVSCSAALSKITGISGKATRGTITKAVWAYIKKKGLSKGRNVGKIDGIFGGGSMFKLTSAVSKHIK